MLGITVFGRRIHEQRSFPELPVELGSHPPESAGASGWSLPLDDLAVRQCRIMPGPESGDVIIVNLGRSIQIGDGVRLFRGQQHCVTLPVVMWIGETMVRLFEVEAGGHASIGQTEGFVALEQDASGEEAGLVPDSAHRSPGIPTLSAWFESLTGLQKATSDDNAFLRCAARALFDPGGFDAGMILRRNDGQWEIAASYVPNPGHTVSFRTELLEQVARSGETCFHAARKRGSSELQISSAVAPVFDENRQLVGAVYGSRNSNPRNNRRGIRRVEAHFLRLVSQTVSAMMIRLAKEREIAESQSLLRQVFPAGILECLRNDPQILEGREKIVTTMFVDVRGFSKIANRLSARTTWQIVTDLMDCWTALIMDNSGVIVDYYGDGLVAFWNAPIDISNHASLAVECGFRLRESLPEINDRWSHIAGAPLDIGIGIATGTSQVGNCGSRQRIKYGPHGASVNLARRLETLTAQTAIPMLVSAETAREIEDGFLVRRLFQAAIKGFAEPVSVWQPIDLAISNPVAVATEYELALGFLESGNRQAAINKLHHLLVDVPDDRAAAFLLEWIREHGGPVIGMMPGQAAAESPIVWRTREKGFGR